MSENTSGCLFLISGIPTVGQKQDRQESHHWNKANQKPAAANNPHLLDTFEVGEDHRQKGARCRERTGYYPLARINHGLNHRLLFTPASSQLLLVSRDQMHGI